ncbi:DUF58 domain-containing protein [Croceiramulus getboli]|nr:DUF58 domain-containing protein [Flavobacteriaceae bacterium YJPT1-3]
MNIQDELNTTSGFNNLDLLARQVVEGFISGLHKSPFHGFSAEFAEHKLYNSGESTKHIDWKLFARTDRLYTKRYEEETNLRCHLILDNSASMHYPFQNQWSIDALNKMSFSVLGAAAIMNILKKQRDAVGLSIFGEAYERYVEEKSSLRHHHLLLDQLNGLNDSAFLPARPDERVGRAGRQGAKASTSTRTYANLHLIAEKLKRRSLVILFSDMFQTEVEQEALFEAVQHLKYNKHELVLFHVYDGKWEQNFDFDNQPRRFVDVETGESIALFADTVKAGYQEEIAAYFEALRLLCLKNKIQYVPADIRLGFERILTTFLVARQKFT